MKRVATFAIIFAMAFGFTAGLTAVNVNATSIFCAPVIDDYFCTSNTGPLCTDPANPYYYMWCGGIYRPSGGLCNCHWVGCCSDPI